MTLRMIVSRVLSVGLAVGYESAVARNVQAQDFKLSPSFTTSQAYDSNLFFAPINRQADMITRVTPSVEADYRTPLVSLIAGYAFDVERFASHHELTSAHAGRRARLTLDYRPTPRMILTADARLSTTQNPGELNVQNGLALGRARAQQVTARSAMVRQLTEVTRGTIDYRFTNERISGGFDVEVHEARIGGDHRLTSRDIVTAEYGLRVFRFTSATAPTSETSHTLTVGLNRAITERATVSMSGGPRVTNGSPAPELSAALRYRLADGDLSIAYTRTETTMIGFAGIAATQSIAGTTRWLLNRFTQVTIAPAFYRSALGGRRADVYRTTVDVVRVVSSNLSIAATLDGNLQLDNLYLALAHTRIPRHNVMIRLTAGPAKLIGLIHAR